MEVYSGKKHIFVSYAHGAASIVETGDNTMKNIRKYVWMPFLLSLVLILSACGTTSETIELASLEYQQQSYVEINDNIPLFEKNEITDKTFEEYSELDDLGRCGVAVACIGKDIMPTEERGTIGQIKPSGWQLAKYDIVDGKYLYNRCHLIGYQLTGDNANEKNLITGTRSMNVDGMLPFENMVDNYIDETNNHVMYRVTPIYDGSDLVAKGVQMEAYSVEDEGEGLSFNVFVFNAQPGIRIDYSDGTSELIGKNQSEATTQDEDMNHAVIDNGKISFSNVTESDNSDIYIYVLNTSTKKFHSQGCPSADDIQSYNKEIFTGSKEYLFKEGYSPCGRCKPY